MNGTSTVELKPKQEWDELYNDGSEANARALFSIFNRVSPNEFQKIANCTCAKEVEDILKVTHEGTSIVKVPKLQMLTSKFESLRMQENYNFSSFYSALSDIVNSFFNLEERIPNSKVVRKIPRSLPERIRPKVTAIEESKDIYLAIPYELT